MCTRLEVLGNYTESMSFYQRKVRCFELSFQHKGISSSIIKSLVTNRLSKSSLSFSGIACRCVAKYNTCFLLLLEYKCFLAVVVLRIRAMHRHIVVTLDVGCNICVFTWLWPKDELCLLHLCLQLLAIVVVYARYKSLVCFVSWSFIDWLLVWPSYLKIACTKLCTSHSGAVSCFRFYWLHLCAAFVSALESISTYWTCSNTIMMYLYITWSNRNSFCCYHIDWFAFVNWSCRLISSECKMRLS